MLKIYITTVVIWLVILLSTKKTTHDKIGENGWLESAKKTTKIKNFFSFVVLSCIPVYRFCIFITMFYMTARTKEEHEKWMQERKEKNNE